MSNIGFLYARGLGVKQDHEKAHSHLHYAARKGHLASQIYVANSYKLGRGVKANIHTSIRWPQKAIDQSSPKAHYNLATLYHQGKYVAADYKKALKL